MVDKHPSIGFIATSVKTKLKLAGVWGTTILTKYLEGGRFEVPVFRIEVPATLSNQATNPRLKMVLICPPLESLHNLQGYLAHKKMPTP